MILEKSFIKQNWIENGFFFWLSKFIQTLYWHYTSVIKNKIKSKEKHPDYKSMFYKKKMSSNFLHQNFMF